MSTQLKKLNKQVIVITGASSGIGLVTARKAAQRGAKLVLVARNEDALTRLADELTQQGHQAIAVAADVGNEQDVRRVADAAIERFGGFDTWVNNAGVSVYGRLDQISLEDHRRLFQTNFWGVVHGSLAAVAHLKSRGGALINVGSQLSDHPVVLQGMYAASKHAVKGFTNSLRQELELDSAPVSVTLIKPAGIDTMFVLHAKNIMDVEAKLPPPIYAPDVVADAILHAAEQPVRDVFIGAAAKMASVSSRMMPALFERSTRRLMHGLQRSSTPLQEIKPGNLYAPLGDFSERGSTHGPVLENSVYTKTAMRVADAGGAALAMGVGMAMLALWSLRRPR